MKALKKTMSLTLALIMLVGIIASTNVFAEGFEKKVVSDLTADINGLSSRLTGTIDLSNNILKNKSQLKDGTTNTYVGTLEGSVEAGDLFAGAYDEYTKLEKTNLFIWYWKNLVMFGKDENTFPNATYTIEFPKNDSLKITNVEVIENTNTISSVKKEVVANKVNFTFNLGNWNDYSGFFDLVKPELKEAGHTINIKIDYEITVPDNMTKEDGIIKCNGACDVYYFGKKKDLVSNPIISITLSDVLFNILNIEK